MCKTLGIPRSTYYKNPKIKIVDTAFENAVIKEFYKGRENYGTRKLQKELRKQKYRVSRRRIGRVMAKYELVSKYTIRNRKKVSSGGAPNRDEIGNIVKREFAGRAKYEVVVSDLTYVRIGGVWRYLCLLLDLCGRKIIGSAVGNKKDAKLVETAFYTVEADLREIKLFHTDRGSEYKNQVIEGILEAFGIERSLSAPGTPHDNAVAESMYATIKTEFTFGREFADMAEFKIEWFDYANWYNNVRIHGSLDYMTPSEWHSLA
jgi:transposase InsO family protein